MHSDLPECRQTGLHSLTSYVALGKPAPSPEPQFPSSGRASINMHQVPTTGSDLQQAHSALGLLEAISEGYGGVK